MQTLSHLSVHVGKSSIARKPEAHPKIFNGTKLLENVTLQIFNFVPVS